MRVLAVEQSGNGGELMSVKYQNGPAAQVLTLRRPLWKPPAVGEEEPDLAQWLAGWILVFELEEPPGSRLNEGYVDGVGWFTDNAPGATG